MYTHSYIYNDGRRPWAYRDGGTPGSPRIEVCNNRSREVIQAASGWIDDDGGGGGGYVIYYSRCVFISSMPDM